MTTTNPVSAPRSVALAARITTLLADQFAEHIPGQQDGFRVESLDHQEPRRMFVRWYGGERTKPHWGNGPELGVEGTYSDIRQALRRAGYAVAKTQDRLEVFVNDRPADTSGPRYTVVRSDVPVMQAWLVLDTWTRVPVWASDSEHDAHGEAHEFENDHVLADARLAVAPWLLPYLDRANDLLGDGVQWLRQEVHDSHDYGRIVQHDRLDALVDVANALRDGYDVVQEGRRVAYATAYPGRAHWPLTYRVQWVPKATAPAVGYFPDAEWKRGPDVDAAIKVLIDGGIQPVVYGESVGHGFMCEQDGFMVSGADLGDPSVPGVHISAMGQAADVKRAPEVLRDAGWTFRNREADWPGDWTAFPPAAG
ncbi:hypothetical protein EF903_05430 [Streptomyces sp. WAC05292]|uniref:hypothetical protein n=1 Tax=Streptomyces sp. WAC05292 TaxID=2487418 RepID=UPI000F7480E7|nr:hypothetical protein [Streptomyces sp. WAC05292]RSS95082.1 hypothetical protein EF903_05430 [Streptomyces sp. WAC05292]